MARARNIKPSLFKNELLGVADPLLTILFESLWCLSDRDGRLEDRPMRIKAETFPYRESLDINVYLTELARLGFIERYTEGSVAVIQVVNFLKHQNPHKTERPSTLPKNTYKSTSCDATNNAPLKTGANTEVARLIPDPLLLIPDPLNTDSLNSVTDVTGGKPPSDRDVIFANGVALLASANVPDKQARSMLAMLCKNHGEKAVRDALDDCARDTPIQPVSWLQARLKTSPRPNKQESLEARNRAVADEWLRQEGVMQ